MFSVYNLIFFGQLIVRRSWRRFRLFTADSHLCFQFKQLCPQSLRLSAGGFEFILIRLQFILPLFLVLSEQSDSGDSLHDQQNQERNEDENYIAGCGFQKLKEFTRTGQLCLILTDHEVVCDKIFIVGIGGRTVGDKSGIPFLSFVR